MKKRNKFPTKNDVIIAIKAEVSDKAKYNKLLGLFMKHPNKPIGPSRHYNSAGYSKERLKQLEYDIKKLYDISDKEVRRFIMAEEDDGVVMVLTGRQRLFEIDLENITVEDCKELTEFSLLDELLPSPLPEFQKGLPGNKERKDWLKENSDIKPANKKAELEAQIATVISEQTKEAFKTAKSNLINAVETEKEVVELEKEQAVLKDFNDAPNEVKQGWKLRAEYPFLDEEDCPEKLMILVNKMITAYKKYQKGREALKSLKETATPEEYYERASSTVENFELNQEIKDELDYYNEHGEILGNHPIFADEMLLQKVESYKESDLKSKRANLRSYISKNTQKLETAKDEKSKDAIQQKINEWQKEIDLIEKRLGDEEE